MEPGETKRFVRICGVHLYGFIDRYNLVVWLVSHLNSASQDLSSFFLVVETLTDPSRRVDLRNARRSGNAVDFCALDAKLRRQNQILGVILTNPQSEFCVTVNSAQIATNIRVSRPRAEDYKLESGSLDVRAKCLGGKNVRCGGGGEPTRVEFFDLEVVATTPQGTYTYPKNRLERTTAPPLTVDDIFRRLDLDLGLESASISPGAARRAPPSGPLLRIVIPRVHVFYVNEEAVWNTGLGEFFRLLYETVYGNFEGDKPLFISSRSTDSTFFPFPHFPAFPFATLEFDSPAFVVYRGRRALWLVDQPGVTRTALADTLWGLSLPPPGSGVGEPLPEVWNVDLLDFNDRLVTADGDFQKILLTEPHILVSVNLRPFLRTLIHSPVLEEEIESVVRTVSEASASIFNLIIGSFVAACLEFIRACSGVWIYLTGFEVCFAVECDGGCEAGSSSVLPKQLECGLREAVWRRLSGIGCVCAPGDLRTRSEPRTWSCFIRVYSSVRVDDDLEVVHWYDFVPLFLRASRFGDTRRRQCFDYLIELLFRYRSRPEFWTIPKKDLSLFPDARPVFAEPLIGGSRVVLVYGGYQEWSEVVTWDLRLDLPRYMKEIDAWWTAVFNETETNVSNYLSLLLLS